MPLDPLGERWPQVYRDAPEVFDLFSRAEDPGDVVAPALIEAARLSRGRVLEVGCGTGRWTRRLASRADCYAALDPQPGMLALAESARAPGANWMLARAEALPFGDDCLERVIAGFVFANLRPRTRVRSIAEARRVLAPEGEIWLLENHWDDEFQDLRRDAGLTVELEVEPLLEDHGFELKATLETEMCFETEELARDVLGQILGPRVDAELARKPRRRLRQRVCLLRAN